MSTGEALRSLAEARSNIEKKREEVESWIRAAETMLQKKGIRSSKFSVQHWDKSLRIAYKGKKIRIYYYDKESNLSELGPEQICCLWDDQARSLAELLNLHHIQEKDISEATEAISCFNS